MRCDEIDKIIADYSVGRLSVKMEKLVREHIESCPACARELEKLNIIMAAVEESPEIEPPNWLWNRVYNEITSPARKPSLKERLGWIFQKPHRVLSVGVAIAAIGVAVSFGISPNERHNAAQIPEQRAMEYVQGHFTEASSGAFADRVSYGFVSTVPEPEERESL